VIRAFFEAGLDQRVGVAAAPQRGRQRGFLDVPSTAERATARVARSANGDAVPHPGRRLVQAEASGTGGG
ncbi:unnamed protein product, partial [Symbiodinium sp. KB8]